MPEEAADLEVFHYQRDSGLHAMSVVKDLHLASNAENAELGISSLFKRVTGANERPITSWDPPTNDIMP